MSKSATRGLMGVALALLLAATAVADVITLTDGSRLVGKVERMEDGKLTLVTEFAGTLTVESAQVQSIQIDEPVNVGMDTGDRLVGPVEWNATVDHAVVQTEMGGVPIDVARVNAIWPKGGESPEARIMREQVEQERITLKEARGKWTLVVEAGVNYTNGNSDTMDARGAITLQHKTADDLLKFYVSGTYAEENQVRSESEAKWGAYYENLISKRWFAYAASDFEYDEFENLNLRAILRGGAGYYWIKTDPHELKTRGGIGFQHESYMDDTSSNAALVDLGVDWRIDIAPWLQFVHGTTYYPTFNGLDDFRLVSDNALLIPLDGKKIWKLKLGALWEYDSKPDGTRKRLDETYYANIQVNIE